MRNLPGAAKKITESYDIIKQSIKAGEPITFTLKRSRADAAVNTEFERLEDRDDAGRGHETLLDISARRRRFTTTDRRVVAEIRVRGAAGVGWCAAGSQTSRWWHDQAHAVHHV